MVSKAAKPTRASPAGLAIKTGDVVAVGVALRHPLLDVVGLKRGVYIYIDDTWDNSDNSNREIFDEIVADHQIGRHPIFRQLHIHRRRYPI